MKYIFPKQWGLHNVFTSNVDKQETVQPFQDYTLREKEIAQRSQDAEKAILKSRKHEATAIRSHLPKRLRGAVVALIRKMQKLHSRCSYPMMMEYYCPLPVRGFLPRPLTKLTALSENCTPKWSHPFTPVAKDLRSQQESLVEEKLSIRAWNLIATRP